MFIDEWFEKDYYQEIPLAERNNHSFGRIYKTHAYYPHEDLQLWRPILNPSDPTQTMVRHFEITTAKQDKFKKSIPYSSPKLETNEEFIVVRAKIRPVILIIPQCPIEDVDTTGYHGKVWRKRCLVAQVFGLADTKTGDAEFNPSFIDRIRKMEFPQLMFLPKHTGLLEVDSVLRLDECQSVYTPHLESTNYALGEELKGILKAQLHYLITQESIGHYIEFRNLLLTDT